MTTAETTRTDARAGSSATEDAGPAAPVEEAPGAQAPSPQPERAEPKLADPGVGDLSKRDYLAIIKRSGREALNDQITDLAAALAYYSFLAIPAALLVAVGVFTLVLSPADINTLMTRFQSVVPKEATDLLGQALTRIQPGSA